MAEIRSGSSRYFHVLFYDLQLITPVIPHSWLFERFYESWKRYLRLQMSMETSNVIMHKNIKSNTTQIPPQKNINGLALFNKTVRSSMDTDIERASYKVDLLFMYLCLKINESCADLWWFSRGTNVYHKLLLIPELILCNNPKTYEKILLAFCQRTSRLAYKNTSSLQPMFSITAENPPVCQDMKLRPNTPSRTWRQRVMMARWI